jgi:nitroimidazol reductase NimA-like FMN-containing flavoprotein (pyridoxamine 5'-phosphate oxidase superfamily)
MLGELAAVEIDELLHSEMVGRIGCHADGRTYIVPVTFAYDGAAVYAHSAGGTKLSMMRSNPEVCFEVEHVDDLANWRSVIAWGHFEELDGDGAMHAIRLLVDRFAPLMGTRTAVPGHGIAGRPAEPGSPTAAGNPAAVLYRIVLGERTGRFERR